MLQLINTAKTALNANDTIPLSVDFNTNPNVIGFNPGTNEVVFLQPGIYEVSAPVVFAATAAGTNSIFAFSSTAGANVPGMTSTFVSSLESQTATYMIAKCVRIAPGSPLNLARMSFKTLTAGTLLNAVVSVKKIR